ncbi:hypothetical protein D3C73_1266190 [compost metagenome]
MPDGLLPLLLNILLLQIAKVRAEQGLISLNQAKGIFAIAAHRQQGLLSRETGRQRQGVGNEPARPAQHFMAFGEQTHQRVVCALQDLAIVHQPQIGNVDQISQCLLIG